VRKLPVILQNPATFLIVAGMVLLGEMITNSVVMGAWTRLYSDDFPPEAGKVSLGPIRVRSVHITNEASRDDGSELSYRTSKSVLVNWDHFGSKQRGVSEIKITGEWTKNVGDWLAASTPCHYLFQRHGKSDAVSPDGLDSPGSCEAKGQDGHKYKYVLAVAPPQCDMVGVVSILVDRDSDIAFDEMTSVTLNPDPVCLVDMRRFEWINNAVALLIGLSAALFIRPVLRRSSVWNSILGP
jgi:hypothetical protein